MILSQTYADNKIYFVRDAFLYGFGRNLLWWLTLLLILTACIVFELVVASGRAGLFPTDVDVFQELEQDLGIRKRFEEAAAMEMQQGWDRGKKKSSLEIEVEQAEQLRREGLVQEMLDNRPMDDFDENRRKPSFTRRGTGLSGLSGNGNGEEGVKRRSTDIERMLRRGFGTIRREHES